MGEQIGSRSRLTPDPLLPGNAGVCGGPANLCTGQAVERIASLPTGMLWVGMRAPAVETGASPLHPASVADSH